MGWAIPNVALSATLYIAFRLRDPARFARENRLTVVMRISILPLIFVAAPKKFMLIDKTTGAV